MKIITLFQIAVKYLLRYRRRYFFLFLALVFGFSVISAISALREGMTAMLYQSAQAHYAGDLMVLGYDNDSAEQSLHLRSTDLAATMKAAQDAGLQPNRTVTRTNFMNLGALYYGGKMVKLKYLTGVDWQAEQDYFDTINYTEKPTALDKSSILISAPQAQELGVSVGSSIVLQVYDVDGQRNTSTLRVAGIINDKTIFGYFKSYIQRELLNELVGFDRDDASMVGFFFDERKNILQKQEALQQALAGRVNMGPLLHNRDDFSAETAAPFKGLRVFLLTIEIYLSELSDLLNALNILSYLLFLLMLIIVFISAYVTYRLILFERTKELGTMRVIGFQESDISWVLVLEAFCLVVLSIVVGLGLSFILVRLFSLLPFTKIPSFEIFMKNGELYAVFKPRTLVFNAVALFLVLLPALGLPAYFMSKEKPAAMLASA